MTIQLLVLGFVFGITITLYIRVLIHKRNKRNKRKLAERIMQQSIDIFKHKHPGKYKRIKQLRNLYHKELVYSGHLGRYRDGSESDRQENIAQDAKVKEIERQLINEVSNAYFKYVVRDVVREHDNESKAYEALLNYQSNRYSGVEVTVIDTHSIGFTQKPIERMFE